MTDEELLIKQKKREEQSAKFGYDKFVKDTDNRKRDGDGARTPFGQLVKKHLLDSIVANLEAKVTRLTGTDVSDLSKILKSCMKTTDKGTLHNFFNPQEVAFIGLQLTLDTAVNPNKVDGNTIGRSGGDKKRLEKKTAKELKRDIGKAIHLNMTLRYIEMTFPEWFRKANHYAKQPVKGGNQAGPRYWAYNIRRAVDLKAEELREQGDIAGAEMIETRQMWSYIECVAVGSMVLSAVLEETHHYLKQVSGTRNGKKSLEIVLTKAGREHEKSIIDFVANHQSDLLPMLIEPQPVINESLGGWLADVLHEPQEGFNGSIWLSDKHLEFINRQAKVAFQINPFTYELIDLLCEKQLPLGKFHHKTLEEIPVINQMLGYAHLEGKEQDDAVNKDPRTRGLRRSISAMISRNGKIIKEGLLSYSTVNKAKKVLEDEQFYIPMKYDFRGRIYSRVPFISFQSNDVGRYLIRFADKTPIDNRTEHWMKIGISNAAGNDKLSLDKRIQWFDKNLEAIIAVGKMMDDDADFTTAYNFLSQDFIDEPFAFAALANEYVKVFIDKTQDYTQCYVCVDASCSGTSIYNAWRRNLNGARLTNLVQTDSPADIYMEVWKEIKRLAPNGTFRPSHIKKLEKSKLIRKMMKTTYVPAQYASPTQEQLKNLHNFNKQLEKRKLEFNEVELKKLQELWVVALDEVSSIMTVVKWFQNICREALKTNNEIYYRSCNGSLMTLKYPKTTKLKARTVGVGSASYLDKRNPKYVQESYCVPNEEVETRKMLQSITANITHLTDAAALCETLYNWEQSPFIGIHDAAGFPCGRHLDDAVARLKEGFITAVQYDVWDALRAENNLPLDPKTAGPVINDLTDWDLVRKSTYLYS